MACRLTALKHTNFYSVNTTLTLRTRNEEIRLYWSYGEYNSNIPFDNKDTGGAFMTT